MQHLRFLRTAGLVSCALALAAGCVTYRPQRADIASAAAAAANAPVPAGPLAFGDAVRLLVRRHPALRATRADIASVNTRPGPAPLAGSTQVVDGRVTETMIGTDVLSLLGLGPRRAQFALARAVRDERICRHHERARDLVGALAEAYAVERALRALAAPSVELDIDAFTAAGLASKSVVAAARSVAAEAAAEGRVLDVERRDARRAIARLIAAGPEAAVVPVPVDSSWPAVQEPERRRLVLARGDLQRLLAAWRVADRRYRHQIARQLPNLSIGLGGNVDLRVPMQLVRIELPLDAPAEARAAAHARDAAYHRLDAGVLDALHEAAAARLALEAAEARLESARERREAAAALVQAERAHVETTPAGLSRLVFVAGRLVDAIRRYREAAVARARAHVGAARAAGWPTPALVQGMPEPTVRRTTGGER